MRELNAGLVLEAFASPVHPASAGSAAALTGAMSAALLAKAARSAGDEGAAAQAIALATLPDACQEVLDRFFARDESYRTIGEALDIPAGTIASRISRCLEKLKTAMEDPTDAARPVNG